MTGATVIECARTWIPTPYVPQASLKGIGTDCPGLILGVGRELGLLGEIALPPYTETDPLILDELLAAHLDPAQGERVGDVLVLTVGAERRHLALAAESTIIHVYGRKYGVTEHIFAANWRRRVLARWRFRGLDG